MSRYRQSDSSFAEIVEGKARRREELMNAIRSADPEVLAEAAERLREAMRKKNPSQRRQRLGPPAFCKEEAPLATPKALSIDLDK